MQEAVPVGEGAMAALLGADLPQAQELAKAASEGDVCEAANDNAPGQVVISGARSAIERAVALTRCQELSVDDLPDKIRASRSTDLVVAGGDPSELVPMEVIEERYIRHVLEAVGGHRTTAARILGLDRKTLYRKLSKYGSSAD